MQRRICIRAHAHARSSERCWCQLGVMVISETGGAANEHHGWEERLRLNPLIALKAFHTIYPVTRDGGLSVRVCARRRVGGRRKRDNSEKTYCKSRSKKCTMVSTPTQSQSDAILHMHGTSYSAQASYICNHSQSFPAPLKSQNHWPHTHTCMHAHSNQHTAPPGPH